MDLIQLNIKGISYSQTETSSYALILEEIHGNKKLPIIIGSFEAQSIALALESDLITKRPVTHDLFTTIARSFDLNLKQVVIHKLEEGVFFSNLYFENMEGKEKVIDSRTSDAISLAIRFNAPIFTSKRVLEIAGIILNPESKDIEESKEEIQKEEDQTPSSVDNPFALSSIEELEEKLSQAIENEDYVLAATLRDEISHRGI